MGIRRAISLLERNPNPETVVETEEARIVNGLPSFVDSNPSVPKPGDREGGLYYFSNGRMGVKPPSDPSSTIEVDENGISWVRPNSYKDLQPHETLSKVGLGYRTKKT